MNYLIFFNFSLKKHIKFQTKFWNVEIKTRNLIDNSKKPDVVGLAYVPTISILPRTLDPPYVAAKIKKDKKVWSFPISIFKDYRRDDEVNLNFHKIF